MADEKKFRLKRKQDGFVVGPITEAQAKTIAGYPDDYEKIDEPKPVVVKDNDQNVVDQPMAKAEPAAAPADKAK